VAEVRLPEVETTLFLALLHQTAVVGAVEQYQITPGLMAALVVVVVL
jgi:hypothetical protein